MSVVLEMQDAGPCRRQLKIEVPAPAVDAEEQRVLDEFAKKARIPGFRKGKVPASIVRRQFASEIEREVLERLLPRYVRQATAEKGLEPLTPPEVEHLHHHAGEPLTFTATIEVRPPIELRNTRDFELPEIPVEVGPDEVATAVAELRRSHAEWIPVDRPAARGDRAEVELSDVAAPAGTPPSPATIEVGAPDVWEELTLAVSGAAPGATVSFNRREGEGEAARERSFTARVARVLEAKLPEVDETFVRHFGRFATAAELEADIARSLGAAKARERRRRREEAVLRQLVERHPLELPPGVVHQEVEDLLRDYATGLARRGVDLEKAQIDWQALGEQARPEAERRVHARLLLDAIAERDAVEVGEEEFESALETLARVQGVAAGALRARLDASGELRGLRAQMRREKVLRYLLGDEPAAAPAAPVESPGAPTAPPG